MKLNSRLKILRQKITSSLIRASVICLAMVLASCATTPSRSLKIIVAPNNVGYGCDQVLNIKFTEVNIPRMRMWNSLILLKNAIAHTPEKVSPFSWGIRVEPNNIKGIPEEKNPWVSINQTNTTLRQVLDELCKQAGWRYEESSIGILFISPPKKFLGVFVVSHPIPKSGSTGYIY